MKRIIAIVLAVAVLLAAAPWWTGRLAEARVDRAFQSLPKNAPYLHIVENKWTPGWFHSEQVITFELVPPRPNPKLPAVAHLDALPQTLRFSVRDTLLHGPLLGSAGIGLARMDSQLVISEDVRKKLVEALGTDAPLQIVTRLGFSGGATTTVSGKARSVALGKVDPSLGNGSIAWDDFSLTIGVARGAASYDVRGHQPRIELRNGDSGLHVLANDLTVQGSGKKISGDLYNGGVTFGMGKLDIGNSGAQAGIDAIQYAANAVDNGDFMDYAMKFGSGAVRSKQLDATGIQLQEIHYDMTLRHLHAPPLQKLMDGLRDTDAKLYDGTADSQAALLQVLKQPGIEILKHDPELVIDRIGIVTPQGAGWLKGSVKLEGVTDADLAAGVMTLLPKLVADFTLEIAQALVDKIPGGATMAGTGVDGGYLKRDGDKLVSHIEFKHGALLVNGKAPQLPKNIQLPGLLPGTPPH